MRWFLLLVAGSYLEFFQLFMSRTRTAIFAISLALLGATGFAHSANSADALVAYFVKIGNPRGLIHKTINSNPAFNLEEKDFLHSVVKKIEFDEFIGMFSHDVKNAFTDEEIRKCTQMVTSDALVKSANIAGDFTETDLAVDALMARLNKQEQDEVVAFFDTACFLKTAEVMYKPENQEKIRLFTYKHICNALNQDRPDILASNELLRVRCSTNDQKDLTKKSR
ncbi:MAG: hypothetical protein ACREO1_01660 [Arenimonas sp.]